MRESKIELTERLRREGRWAEASKRKDEMVKLLRAEGMKRTEATEEAWRRLAVEYPPLPSTLEPEPGDDKDDSEGVAVVLAGSSALPDAWGELHETALFDAEVEWVHQNRVLVVEERAAGKSLLHWERARKPAPSYGAVNLMEYAATNRKGFMDILQKVKPGDSGDAENVRREKMSIAEIQQVLGELNQQWADELVANVPETIRATVRRILDGWARRSALMIHSEAKADLEAHIAGLVQECLDATAKVKERKEMEEKKAAHIGKVLADIGRRE